MAWIAPRSQPGLWGRTRIWPWPPPHPCLAALAHTGRLLGDSFLVSGSHSRPGTERGSWPGLGAPAAPPLGQ